MSDTWCLNKEKKLFFLSTYQEEALKVIGSWLIEAARLP